MNAIFAVENYHIVLMSKKLSIIVSDANLCRKLGDNLQFLPNSCPS